jgi:hypothetical protein
MSAAGPPVLSAQVSQLEALEWLAHVPMTVDDQRRKLSVVRTLADTIKDESVRVGHVAGAL